jgi:hypothetical protein
MGAFSGPEKAFQKEKRKRKTSGQHAIFAHERQ